MGLGSGSRAIVEAEIGTPQIQELEVARPLTLLERAVAVALAISLEPLLNLVTDKLAPVPFCCYSHISCCGGYCKCFCSALVKSNAADKNWITCATTTQRWEFCSEVWISVFVGIARNSSSLADPYSSCLASSRCIMV
ncbi:hypothetical protein CMV_028299 [Castanea mollissima]|uniref:Uncharacterized protein n=1 Tax=Castanea mollissima TaxID=60419 RepID=A0A8J4Q836_9ROSI|nr:hypothetical protein CMV_028299 [Castanea mollissima]